MKRKWLGLIAAAVISISTWNCVSQAAGMQIDKADGEYSIQVDLEGGSGKAMVTSPTILTVKDGQAYVPTTPLSRPQTLMPLRRNLRRNGLGCFWAARWRFSWGLADASASPRWAWWPIRFTAAPTECIRSISTTCRTATTPTTCLTAIITAASRFPTSRKRQATCPAISTTRARPPRACTW